MPLPVLEIISGISSLLDRFAPNKTEQERQKAAREILELTMAKDLAQGQLDINKVEAENQNLFVSGWRPFVGWVCGMSFALYAFVIPLINYVLLICGMKAVPLISFPPEVMQTMMGLLGIAWASRSYEKVKGVKR